MVAKAQRRSREDWEIDIAAFGREIYTAGLERAAEIAEGRQSQDTDWDVSYWNQACVNIATAIRAEKNQD